MERGEGGAGITGGMPSPNGSSSFSVGYVRLRPTGLAAFECVAGDRLGVFDDDDVRDSWCGELSSGIAGMLLGGECERLATRGNVWLLPSSLVLLAGGRPSTISGDNKPRGSSEKVCRNMLDEADVGGVSISTVDIVDIEAVSDGIEESRLAFAFA